MKYITFNPIYVLKPDDGRTLLLAKFVGRNLLKGVSDSFTDAIHPIYAMILSFIDGREHCKCISDAANELGVPEELVNKFIETLVDNPNKVYLKSNDGISSFPPYTIISLSKESCIKRYEPSMFEYSNIDLCLKRHLTPSLLTIMFNNICVTDCIYCYQDKSRKVDCGMPLNRILALIQEAYDLHVNTIDVIGGEFFLYRHWKEVLRELRKYGYNPYISTKVPLSEEDAQFLADIHLHDIQISIDTLIEKHLIDSIGVRTGYKDRILKSLSILDKYKIPVMIHSVLTQFNDSVEDMQSIYKALKGLGNIVDWHIVKGDPSMYPKTDYKNIEIDGNALNTLVDYLSDLSQESEFPIRFPQRTSTKATENHQTTVTKKEAEFFNRSFCSGLYSALYILPDGQVTMCEQLYWNKRFIVGNILTQTLSEVWNSDKAKSLYYIKQEDIPEDSLCHSCEKYEKCRKYRQVCYREIIRKYGKDKWYYPDASCPYANIQKN